MLALAVGITLDHDGLGVVEQNMPRYPAKIDQRLAQARAKRFRGLIDREAIDPSGIYCD